MGWGRCRWVCSGGVVSGAWERGCCPLGALHCLCLPSPVSHVACAHPLLSGSVLSGVPSAAHWLVRGAPHAARLRSSCDASHCRCSVLATRWWGGSLYRSLSDNGSWHLPASRCCLRSAHHGRGVVGGAGGEAGGWLGRSVTGGDVCSGGQWRCLTASAARAVQSLDLFECKSLTSLPSLDGLGSLQVGV